MTRKGVLDLDGKLLWAADHFPTDPWSPDDAVVLTYTRNFRDSCNARVVGEMQVRDAKTGAELAALPGAVRARLVRPLPADQGRLWWHAGPALGHQDVDAPLEPPTA